MAVPTYDKFVEPILRYLAAHPAGAPAKDAHEAAANSLGIGEEDRLQLVPSGKQPTYKNRCGWAHDRLKRAGLSSSPRRGYWLLTKEGTEFAVANKQPLTAEQVERLATGFMDVRLRPEQGNVLSHEQSAQAQPEVPLAALASPDDRLGEAIAELRRSVSRELLEVLGGASPTFFETVVLDLLHRMGYGANRSDLQRVGGSGDAGIDGVISLDKLGLEKVYVQAKRWQGVVGRPEVQGFYGALAGQRANKGVFITTSGFTAQATEFARSVERIVLVDGTRLADLMMDYEVGVSARTIKVPKVDSDYFDEETS